MRNLAGDLCELTQHYHQYVHSFVLLFVCSWLWTEVNAYPKLEASFGFGSYFPVCFPFNYVISFLFKERIYVIYTGVPAGGSHWVHLDNGGSEYEEASIRSTQAPIHRCWPY